jgi:RNA-directed DNA polymerase
MRAVRRVFIPKRGGQGQRPLGIPTIRDRTAQMAAVLVLGPIFEADLAPEQHAYRPERDALSAVNQVHGLARASGNPCGGDFRLNTGNNGHL